MEKSQAKLELLERIRNLEQQQLFDQDVEDDPAGKELKPNKVDYLNKKLSSKILNKIANKAGTKFFEGLIDKKQFIIDKIEGIENFLEVKDEGLLITCNHFSICDNYAVWRAIKPHMGKKLLYKVIKEGNYTNSPGAFGLLMRHCNTLPLSSNRQTMKKFMDSLDILLKRGEKVLIYPEQAMWWNYKKPRPLKDGAFRFAVASDVKVLPMFITMEDSDILDPDGFYVQKFTIHILPAISSKPELNRKENIEFMRQANYEAWVKTYETTYNKKLTYAD